MYQTIKNILFKMDAEQAHHFTMRLLSVARFMPFFNTFFSGKLKDEKHLGKTVAGLYFPNPIGMAAGFDKNALYLDTLAQLGFGFIEIGTVTPKPQEGNPKPRLFRLPQDQALINRMGFNNDGAEVIASRLKNRNKNIVVGGNIGKNKVTPNESAVSDYLICFEALYEYVDYFVVNVSSPNTPNLRELQDKDALYELLNSVQQANMQKPKQKPVFLKIAPDLSNSQLDEIIEIVKQTNIAGIIATNTTISREGLKTDKAEVEKIGAGGLSGKPLTERAIQILQYLRKNLPKEIALISSGGVMTAEDAANRLKSGADLVQLYTGFIYEGPQLIKRIKQKLL
ncbi:MAG: quinone-dependent dihydroorotate dehydrogenase [Bacteroidia bacterium]